MSVGLAGALLLPRGWGDQPCPGAWEDGDCLTLPRRLECFLGHQTPSGASSVILCEYIFRSFFFFFFFFAYCCTRLGQMDVLLSCAQNKHPDLIPWPTGCLLGQQLWPVVSRVPFVAGMF